MRPPKIDDLVWELLEKCWSRKPASRPKTVELRNPFSDRVFYREPPTARDSLSSSEPEAEFQPTTAEELPGKLRVLVQNIKILVDERKKRRFTVKLAYGNHIYVTAPTRPVDSSPGYTWSTLRSLLPLPLSLNPKQDRPGKLDNNDKSTKPWTPCVTATTPEGDFLQKRQVPGGRTFLGESVRYATSM